MMPSRSARATTTDRSGGGESVTPPTRLSNCYGRSRLRTPVGLCARDATSAPNGLRLRARHGGGVGLARDGAHEGVDGGGERRAALSRAHGSSLPCGDGSLTVSELAESAKARATRLMPGVALEGDARERGRVGGRALPRGPLRDVLDNDGAVALSVDLDRRGWRPRRRNQEGTARLAETAPGGGEQPSGKGRLQAAFSRFSKLVALRPRASSVPRATLVVRNS